MDTIKTKKPPLFIDEYVIQGNYSQGWEDVTATNDWKEARQLRKDYRENEPQYPHRTVTRKEFNQEAHNLECLNALPTLSVGQFDDLKIETKRTRVWLSRMTKADGMQYNNQVTVEKLNSRYNWVIVLQYQVK